MTFFPEHTWTQYKDCPVLLKQGRKKPFGISMVVPRTLQLYYFIHMGRASPLQHRRYSHTGWIPVLTSIEIYWVGKGRDRLSTKSDAESQRPRQLTEMWSNQQDFCKEAEVIFICHLEFCAMGKCNRVSWQYIWSPKSHLTGSYTQLWVKHRESSC